MIQLSFTLKVAVNSGLLLIILAFGRVLHTTGRPYLTGLFTAHILATVAFVAYLAFILRSFMKYGDPAASLTAWVITGFLLSLERFLIPSLWLHRLATAGLFISLAGILWKLAAA